MSDASIIKEFLVALGFKLDAKGAAQMQKGIQSISASAVALGELVAKAAEAVAKAVVKMAQDLDQLYFTSRRVNAAAENIKAFSFAIEQMGGNLQGAQAALEGIASFMRSNPGGEGFIQGLGVATRDANGQLRDTTDILGDLGKKFAQMPFYMAKIRAALLGIDEKTLIAIENPDFGKEEGKYKDFAARLGLGMDAGADASNKFAEKIRDLKAEFGLLFIAGASQLLPMFQQFADWLSRIPIWFSQIKSAGLGKEFSGIAAAAGQFIDAAVRLAGVIAKIVGPAFSVLINTNLKLLVDVLRILTGLITGIADILTGKWGAAWKVAVTSVQGFVDTVKDLFSGLFGMIAGLWKGFTSPGGTASTPGAGPAPAGTLGAANDNPMGSSAGHDPIPANRLPRSVRNNNPGNLRGPGGGYAQFNSAAAGFAAMRAQILRDFNVHGLRTIAALINDRHWGWANEWSAGNNHQTAMNYIARVAKALGISSNAQLNLSDPATLQRLMNAMAGVESGGSFFRSPLGGAGGYAGASINQKTDIHISGVNEPVAAGRVVAASQERVNGNLIRNLKTAVA